MIDRDMPEMITDPDIIQPMLLKMIDFWKQEIARLKAELAKPCEQCQWERAKQTNWGADFDKETK